MKKTIRRFILWGAGSVAAVTFVWLCISALREGYGKELGGGPILQGTLIFMGLITIVAALFGAIIGAGLGFVAFLLKRPGQQAEPSAPKEGVWPPPPNKPAA